MQDNNAETVFNVLFIYFKKQQREEEQANHTRKNILVNKEINVRYKIYFLNQRNKT